MLQRTLITRATSLAFPTIRSIRYSSSAPASVIDRSFWRSLIPKPLRKENRQALKASYGKGWNPATFFIVMFLLVGSMSIQMIALRKSFERYMRSSEVRIGLLREVVERIQNGETVDVEKALGTGEPEKEADWEEVLRSIEQAEVIKKPQKEAQPEPELQPVKAAITKDEQLPPSKTPPALGKSASGFGSFF